MNPFSFFAHWFIGATKIRPHQLKGAPGIPKNASPQELQDLADHINTVKTGLVVAAAAKHGVEVDPTQVPNLAGANDPHGLDDTIR